MTTVGHLPAPPPGLQVIELTAAHETLLQGFFESNPGYALSVYGHPPSPHEAHETIHDTLPEGWSFTRLWVIGYLADDDRLVAMASVVSDLLAPGVWHIGLFMVATDRQGSGLARVLFAGLEDWARAHGARWLRLGVVLGNVRAERFWQAQGFIESRRRQGVAMGQRVNTIRVMYKPLSGGSLMDYLALVPRDRADAPDPASAP